MISNKCNDTANISYGDNLKLVSTWLNNNEVELQTIIPTQWQAKIASLML
ncbi:MAG: hypothetical protein SGJ04_04805 [Bacteroidota bacterium]|nr:hypothetical protein [Bacteroidota bacterium]